MPVLAFFKVIPAWAYKLLGVAIICLGIFLAGEHRVQTKWDAEKAAAKEHVTAVVSKQESVTNTSQAVQVVTEEKIKTVFKDRIVYKDRLVPHEVIVKEDAACVIPDRFISMWNSANSGEVPTTSSSVDAGSDGSRAVEGTR
jgi:predicted RND superfamily exporter protein